MAGEPPPWVESKLPNANVRQSLITIVVVLGFMVSAFLYLEMSFLTSPQAHGYATDEFEVTRERLGVYRPVRPRGVSTFGRERLKYGTGRTHR